MEHLSNHRIKGFLTIIVKIVLSVLIVINLSCNKNKMDEQNFKVFGEESLLKDCKINISIYTQIGYDNTTSKYSGTEELKTLLFNGNSYKVKSLKDYSVYTVYVSYKDSLVNKVVVENIFYATKDQIAADLYINKTNDTISILFLGKEAVLVSLDDYFRLNKINKDELKNKEKKLFFDFYGK